MSSHATAATAAAAAETKAAGYDKK